MFSIIIPLYNKAPYVEKAIRSVMAQTYRGFELIVVDDGSTDNSLETVKGLQLSAISYQLLSQSNSGVSTARNNGVKAAKYPYICFLDADDWWEPAFLEEMKALIEEFPDAGIYGSGYYIVKHGRNRIAPVGVDQGFEKGEINYFRVYAKTLCMPLTSISVAIPKTVFETEKGFKPQLKYSEDFDLWLRIALKYPVAFNAEPLVYYNQDVDFSNRALSGKLHPKENDFIFNTDFLLREELQNEDLKKLLDKQRVTFLPQYYFNKKRKQDASNELLKVNWENQTVKDKLLYKILPYSMSKFYYLTVKNMVKLKKYIISHKTIV